MLSTKLRIEESRNSSGKLLNVRSIRTLKEKDYLVENIVLDGDAPKQFIRVYFYGQDSGVLRRSPATWIPYIAKTAEKWYPHESVIEYMINRIGQVAGLNMNEVELLTINGQIRFLSKYFLTSSQTLIHGAEICGEYLDDMPLAAEIANEKTTSRELFTFEFVCKAIHSKFGNIAEILVLDLVRMLAFDALVGNNDRHFYNWGVINAKKKARQLPTFAPLYDSARGLLWNKSDDVVKKLKQIHESGGKRVSKYIEEACPRISIDGNSEINHFGLISYLKKLKPEYKVVIDKLSSIDNEVELLGMLKREFFSFFIAERCQMTTYILKERFKRIREV